LREVAAEAVITLSARGNCTDQDTFANLVSGDAHANFMDDPYGFVADHQAGPHRVFTF